MEKVILFGKGDLFNKLYKFLNQEKEFEIISIWDNNKNYWGEKIFIKDKMIEVSAPNKNNQGYNIIIMTSEYEDEIKVQLMETFKIESQYIKPWNYCLCYVKKAIIQKYEKSKDEEIRKILKFLEKHELCVFNYSFMSEKEQTQFEVFKDEDCGLFYVYWKNKRIYLKRSINTVKKVKRYLALIQMEQNFDSPHCYQQPGFEVTEEDIVVDAGSAEGFYALEAVETAKKVYIIEGNSEWLEALYYTFKPYKDKIEIIPKWLGEKQDISHISIDEINEMSKSQISLIKLDIEGEEINALRGAEDTLKHNPAVRLLICSYHNSNDEENILSILSENSYRMSFSKGYMFFPWEKSIKPELRHGMVLGQKKMHGKILVWGIGKKLEIVLNAIKYDVCIVSALIDTEKRGIWKNYEIILPEEINQKEYSLIVISVIQYKSVLEKCMKIGIPRERLYVFWDETQCENPFINEDKRQVVLLKSKREEYEQRLLNIPYEFEKERVPIIHSNKETLYEILTQHKSLCRFGDGEFELIRGRERPWFQKTNENLAARLKEVLQSNDSQILIAIANFFGKLDKYTEDAASAIRKYITNGTTRNDIMQMLDLERGYYDAFVSRPYLIYKDKTWAKTIFGLMRQVWENRKVILVEGQNSYMGVGNDLFETASSIRRVICPAKDAFNNYDEIFKTICFYAGQSDLVLISLGPTATVLAYDLAKAGIQAIDIGHIDNEYDWYKKGSLYREEILGKCVAELSYWHEPQPVYNEKYQREIIAKISSVNS